MAVATHSATPAARRSALASARIAASGVLAPAGDSAAGLAAALRAGISCYRELPGSGRLPTGPWRLAPVPDDAVRAVAPSAQARWHLTARQARILALAAPALASAAAGAPGPLPLVIAAPDRADDGLQVVYAGLLPILAEHAGVALDLGRSAVVAGGRAAGFAALDAAFALLAAGQRRVLVGGADSLLDPDLLIALRRDGRLHEERAGDAFVPGEGAAFLLLAADDAPGPRIHAPGIAHEPGHRGSPEPCRGDGLSAAIAAALTPVGRAAALLSGLTGEYQVAREWGVAAIRNRDGIADDARALHLFAVTGDLGAAAAPALLACAAAWRMQGGPRAPFLAWCTAEGSLRGAACVS